MKIWQKDFTNLEAIDRFTVGRDRELDVLLAPYDVLGALAHVHMLTQIGLIEQQEGDRLVRELRILHTEVQSEDFRILEEAEDIHSHIEAVLTERLGEAGKRIHSGRSRNDQVLVDLRLFFRSELERLARRMQSVFETLQKRSERDKGVMLPGYTHYQVAMVSSFGLWWGAYAENLVDDLQQLVATYRIINQNPLGSAAGYGSSFPLDRQLTTDLLGFDDLSYNVVHAQMGRGKTELTLAFSLAALAHTLGKLAGDLVLYNSQNFGFVELPDEVTTGSSIMPHKKNPDVFELIRGRCQLLLTLPAQVAQLTGGLPSGYHRDFQLLKELLFPAIAQMGDVLDMLQFVLPKIQVRTGILEEERYRYLYSVEEVNRLVLSGTPFRDAYRQVGDQIARGAFDPDRELLHTHLGSLGNLATAKIRAKWDRTWEAFPFARVREREERLLKG